MLTPEEVAATAQQISQAGAITTVPLFTYVDNAALNAHLEIDRTSEPTFTCSNENGTVRIIRAETPEEYCKALMEQPGFYVAERQNAVAASAKIQQMLSEENAAHSGQENYNYLPALFVSLQALRDFAQMYEENEFPDADQMISEQLNDILQYPIDDPSI